MSTILLDTHVAVWLLNEPARIGPHARAAIDGAHVVHFSALSTAEATIKRMLGRWSVPAELDQILIGQGLQSLPLSTEHASALDRFPDLARHDPFDRLLLAQAFVENCLFVTADRRLLGLGLGWVLDATS